MLLKKLKNFGKLILLKMMLKNIFKTLKIIEMLTWQQEIINITTYILKINLKGMMYLVGFLYLMMQEEDQDLVNVQVVVIDNISVFRIFNALICLRDHSSNMHKNDKGFGYITKGSIVNLKYDKEKYKIGTIEQGTGKRHYLVKKEIVDKFNWEAGGKQQNEEKLDNELKITGWNMMKALLMIM